MFRLRENCSTLFAVRLLSFERAWLLSVFETILPSDVEGGLELGARDLPLSGFVDELVRYAPRDVIWGIRLFLLVLLVAPLFVLGRWRTFHGLEPEARLECLERLRQSSVYAIREIPLFFKLLACLGHSGHPSVHAELGLEPRDESPPSWERAS